MNEPKLGELPWKFERRKATIDSCRETGIDILAPHFAHVGYAPSQVILALCMIWAIGVDP